MIKYSILVTEEEAMQMNKDAFKKMINKAVVTVAFEELREECASKSKTKNMTYPKFKRQDYLEKFFPNQIYKYKYSDDKVVQYGEGNS